MIPRRKGMMDGSHLRPTAGPKGGMRTPNGFHFIPATNPDGSVTEAANPLIS